VTDRRRRFILIASAVCALVLTVWGLDIAATDANYPTTDSLRLGATPPTSVAMSLHVSGLFSVPINANVSVNFDSNQLSGAVQADEPFATIGAHVLYDGAHPGQLAVSTNGVVWSEIGAPNANLFGLALELTRPDLDLIGGFDSQAIVHRGVLTDHVFSRASGVTPLGGNGPLTLTITTGASGEVTGAALVFGGAHPVDVTLTVDAYNHYVSTHEWPHHFSPTTSLVTEASRVIDLWQALFNQAR
jgi:hypothetical protein